MTGLPGERERERERERGKGENEGQMIMEVNDACHSSRGCLAIGGMRVGVGPLVHPSLSRSDFFSYTHLHTHTHAHTHTHTHTHTSISETTADSSQALSYFRQGGLMPEVAWLSPGCSLCPLSPLLAHLSLPLRSVSVASP